jgi:hypothetical protein
MKKVLTFSKGKKDLKKAMHNIHFTKNNAKQTFSLSPFVPQR